VYFILPEEAEVPQVLLEVMVEVQLELALVQEVLHLPIQVQEEEVVIIMRKQEVMAVQE
jgi:hypothetical protein